MQNNIFTQTSNKMPDRTGTWWTCLILHAILVIFYLVWFVVGVTVALWVEIPVNSFGRFVQLVFGPVAVLGSMFFYVVLVGTVSLILFRRPSFFTSVRGKIIGALYLSCAYALREYSSNLFYFGYRPESEFNPEMYIVQMNMWPAGVGFPLSVILGTLAIELLFQNEDEKVGAIQLPVAEL